MMQDKQHDFLKFHMQRFDSLPLSSSIKNFTDNYNDNDDTEL